MTDYQVYHDVAVRFRDLDPMGHVNNAVYNSYLEEARMAYWKLAQPETSLESIPFILARVEIDYRSPALSREVIRVALRAEWIGEKSFAFSYFLSEKVSGRAVAEALSIQVYFDYGNERPAAVPDELRREFARIEGRAIPPRP